MKYKQAVLGLWILLMAMFVLGAAPSTPTVISPNNNTLFFNPISLTASGSTDADGSPFNITFFQVKDTKLESDLNILSAGNLVTEGTSFSSPHVIEAQGSVDEGAAIMTNVTFTNDYFNLQIFIRDRNLDNVLFYIDGDKTKSIFSYNGTGFTTGGNDYLRRNTTLDVSDYNDGSNHSIVFFVKSGATPGQEPRLEYWWNTTNITRYGDNAGLSLYANGSATTQLWNFSGTSWTARACDNDQNCSTFTENRTLLIGNFSAQPIRNFNALEINFRNLSSPSQIIDGSLDEATFTLTNDDVFTFTYSNNTARTNNNFSLFPTFKNIPTIAIIKANAPAFEQSIFHLDRSLRGDTLHNQTIYLLPTGDGIFVTFQIFNVQGSPIDGALVTADRIISGNTITVGSGLTDTSGGLTLFLNPLVTHTISASKAGVGSTSLSITPTEPAYTLVLGGAAFNETSPFWGIQYDISPKNIILSNSTKYNFTFDITSSFWNLTNYGFTLFNSTGHSLGTLTGNDENGSTITLELNVGNNTQIQMDAFWNVDEQFTNITKSWTVRETLTGSLSIKHFFDDFAAYAAVGFGAGFNTFGQILLSIVILILVVAGLNVGLGINGTTGVMTLVAFTVVALEIVNVMPPLVRKYLLSVFIIIVWIGFVFRDVSR